MIQISSNRYTRTFTVDGCGVTKDHPLHEGSKSAILRELQQRGLRPDGDVTIASIEEQEPDRYGQPRTVITYAVALRSEEV